MSPAEFFVEYPHLEGKRIILFLGRIHSKKKGVDLLVKAWGQVSSILPDAHLAIAGPDNGALKSLLSANGSPSPGAGIDYALRHADRIAEMVCAGGLLRVCLAFTFRGPQHGDSGSTVAGHTRTNYSRV